MLTEMGAQPLLFPITSDNPLLLRTAICAAAGRADIILLCGGSSKGGEDFNAGLAGELAKPLKATPGMEILRRFALRRTDSPAQFLWEILLAAVCAKNVAFCNFW